MTALDDEEQALLPHEEIDLGDGDARPGWQGHPPLHHQGQEGIDGGAVARGRSATRADPPNFRPVQTRQHSRPRAPGDGLGSILSAGHPDDESSKFIRASRQTLLWCIRGTTWLLIEQAQRIAAALRLGTDGAIRKVDVSKLALMGLAALALVFMEVGTADLNNSTSMYAGRSGASEFLDATASDRGILARRSSGGYQARSQVPIPIEYANFVDLSEFVDAVAAVRAHRQEMMRQQQQNQQQIEQRGRRLEDVDKEDAGADADAETEAEAKKKDVDNDKKGDEAMKQENTEEDEEAEMNNAMEDAWKQAKETNPELQQQQSNALQVKHVPFFWHIPRTGGTTVSTLLSKCHSLVQATSSFSSLPLFSRGKDEALASRFRDPKLYVVGTHGQSFVNVDLDSLEGVQRAVKGGLIKGELADVVAVPDVRLGSLLFGDGRNHLDIEKDGDTEKDGDGSGGGITKKEYKGVLFSMFRHPIERSVSLFYYKQNAKESVHHDASLETFSLVDWINSPLYVTDYMVRTLVGKIDSWVASPDPDKPGSFRPPVPLTRDDLDVAKEILRRKCIVGLLDEKGESMRRFERFFGWSADVRRDSLFLLEDKDTAEAVQAERWKTAKDEECRDRLLHWDWVNKNMHPDLEEGSVEYNLLESKNRYDIELYMYAEQLFDEQYIQLGFDDNGGEEGDLLS